MLNIANDVLEIRMIKGKSVKGTDVDVLRITSKDKNYCVFELFCDETLISDKEIEINDDDDKLSEATNDIFKSFYELKDKVDYVKHIIDNRHAERLR